MKLIRYWLAVSMLLVTSQAVAQECYLATECGGGDVCVNLRCVTPDTALSSCSSHVDCNFEEACVGGVCKLEAVACASAAGEGYVGISSAEFECGNGMGEGWAGGMDCASSDDGGDVCIVPDINDSTASKLDELYAQCVEKVASLCGETVPVPADECSPESLGTCTDWALYAAQLEQQCGEDWGVMEGDSSDDSSVDDATAESTAPTPDSPEIDDATDDGFSGSAEGGIQINGLFSLRGLADTTDPWLIVDCCEDMDGDPQTLEMYDDLRVCTDNLTNTDCDNIYNCFLELAENYDLGDSGGDSWDTTGEAKNDGEDSAVTTESGDDDESDPQDDPQDNDMIRNDDGEGESAPQANPNDADSATSGGSASDSGCTVTSHRRPVTSLLLLIF